MSDLPGNPLRILLALLLAAALSNQPASAESTFVEQTEIGQELGIPVHEWTSKDSNPQAVVVALHGMVFDGRAYEALGTHLAEKGYAVFAADMRGFGDWKKDNNGCNGDQLFHFTKSKDDLTRLLQTLRQKFPNLPIYCLGESLGANYAIWEASTNPELMDGAVLSGISYKVAVHPKPIWVRTFFESLVNPKKQLDLVPYVQPIMSEDKSVRDESVKGEHTQLTMSMTDLIKAAITNKRAVSLIQNIPESMPILIIAGEKDMIQKTSTIHHMVSRMGSKKTEFVVLPKKGHLLLEREKVDVEAKELIDRWLDQQVAVQRAQMPAATTEGTISKVNSCNDSDTP